MTMGGRDMETVLLQADRMNMRLSKNNTNQEPVDLPLFNIIRWSLAQRNADCPKEGIRMIVMLRRKPWRDLLTTYLPTILLMLTTYITTFFKPQFFDAALAANLTTMLMMTTIFMAISSDLTDTAYAKWIDIWLIFCQLVPFTEVVFITVKEAYREEKEDDKENTQDPSTSQLWAAPVDRPADSDLLPPVIEESMLPVESKESMKKSRSKLYWWQLVGELVNQGII